MTIDLATLKDRASKIEAAIAQVMTNFQNLLGQKNEISFWITELENAATVAVDVTTHAPLADTIAAVANVAEDAVPQAPANAS